MDRYFYIVEECNGHKEVHFSGNVYFNDVDETKTCFRYAEWVGVWFDIAEMKELLDKGLLYESLCEKVEYLTDLTETQAVDMCETYFGETPGTRLHISRVNEDTPCGDYWFE